MQVSLMLFVHDLENLGRLLIRRIFGARCVHRSVSDLLRDVADHKAGVEARYLQFHPVLNHSVKHCGDLLEAVVCRVKLVGPFFPVVSRLFERISCIDVKDFSGILCLKGLEHRV